MIINSIDIAELHTVCGEGWAREDINTATYKMQYIIKVIYYQITDEVVLISRRMTDGEFSHINHFNCLDYENQERRCPSSN